MGNIDEIASLLEAVRAFRPESPEALESFRIQYLGQKGILKSLFEEFKSVAVEEKKTLGQQINALKLAVQDKITSCQGSFGEEEGRGDVPDLSMPAEPAELGSRHPVSIVCAEITDIFSRQGFVVAEGPEIEDDYHNFTALNFPHDHPARDMQDTFFVARNPDMLLRTHTSSVQIRMMETRQPPIRIICPGRVFRNEAISARSHCIFHQVEGLYVDRGVSFADLKQTLLCFVREFFGPETDIRLRPSYFPFTEPSAEVDVSCSMCGGKGCRVCKHTGWLEIMGCGMVDPNVLDNCGINSDEFTGFAFGMGIERPAMLKYKVDDIRLFFENDMRFLSQFVNA